MVRARQGMALNPRQSPADHTRGYTHTSSWKGFLWPEGRVVGVSLELEAMKLARSITGGRNAS